MVADIFLNMLVKELDHLQTIHFPWLNSNKIQKLKIKLIDHAGGLRDRKSKLHLSASAMVFSEQYGYFIRHPYLKTVLLPAGHVENNEVPLNCAVREFHEETGYQVKPDSGRLIGVNLIQIPANPAKSEGAHQHIDFRFGFLLETGKRADAELPVFLLTKNQAPNEFSKYFILNKSGDEW